MTPIKCSAVVAALFSGMCTAVPWEYEVDFNFSAPSEVHSHMGDGDTIILTSTPMPGTPGMIQVGLKCDAGTWWKAITKFHNDDYKGEVVATQDETGRLEHGEIQVEDLDTDYFVLSKAKTFGVHTNIYHIRNAREMKQGMMYTFDWVSDATKSSMLQSVAQPSCFGKNPHFDQSCATYKTQSACQTQVACTWGELGHDDCFSKDGDPTIERLCKEFGNETACSNQVGCAWQSNADAARWYAAIEAGVSAFDVSAPTMPDSIGLGQPTYVSAHDHKEVGTTMLDDTLAAWTAKYSFPDSAQQSLRALVAVESVEYRSFNMTLASDMGVSDEVAAGGRNWGGVISLAFVKAQTKSVTTKYYPNVACAPSKWCTSNGEFFQVGGNFVTCMNGVKDCEHQPDPSRAFDAAEVQAASKQMQAWSYQRLVAENALVKDEILRPRIASQNKQSSMMIV